MHFDVVIIGAGGAGLMCAAEAAKRGRRVIAIDHAKKLGGKILISGGGRCNFTNIGASPDQYVSENPHFCKSALSRFTPDDFIQLVKKHGIAFHEKKLGQLFCDRSAQEIVDLLKSECQEAGVELRLQTEIIKIEQTPEGTQEETSRFRIKMESATQDPETLTAESLVIATGGLSIPKVGATGLGYEIARQFGLGIVETAPALDGFVFSENEKNLFNGLSGISADCKLSSNGVSFRENILITHSGLSGPAALQGSLHWFAEPSRNEVRIDFTPGVKLFEWFILQKKTGRAALVKTLLAEHLSVRLADRLCEHYFPASLNIPLPQISERELKVFCDRLQNWTFIPAGTVGYSKAEVTRGGVDTRELSSKTLECIKIPGLYFVGEVVDVTGWLGGYNFQWAWASGWAAGQVC